MTNDLISRSALDGMKLFVAPGERPNKETIGWNGAIDYVIKTARAVDAEVVRHGWWINKTMPMYTSFDYRFDCSVCGHIFYAGGIETFKYCPWCGARMDGDEHA